MEKLISGIHNYCDRWCERCAFTTRCAVGIEETKITDKERDITNIEFWNSLSENFEKTFLLLEKAAKFHGIDLNEVSKQNEDEYLKREKSRPTHSDHHYLFTGGTEYANRVHKDRKRVV